MGLNSGITLLVLLSEYIQVWLSLYYNVCIYSSAHSFSPQLQLHWWRTSHVSSGPVLPGGCGLMHHMSSWILLSRTSSSSLSHPSKYPWVFTQYCANKWGSIQHVMKYLYNDAIDERQSMYVCVCNFSYPVFSTLPVSAGLLFQWVSQHYLWDLPTGTPVL